MVNSVGVERGLVSGCVGTKKVSTSVLEIRSLSWNQTFDVHGWIFILSFAFVLSADG
jgi:hypothetical protein